MGLDVTCAVRSFLSSNCIIRQLNYIMVSLIPKVFDPQHMSQLRPITLCNVLYKIGSNVIVNRLKIFMDSIILDQHGAFVLGRLLSDNSLVLSEVDHYLHSLWRG